MSHIVSIETEVRDALRAPTELPLPRDRSRVFRILQRVGERRLGRIEEAEALVVAEAVSPCHDLHARRGAKRR